MYVCMYVICSSTSKSNFNSFNLIAMSLVSNVKALKCNDNTDMSRKYCTEIEIIKSQ